MPGKGGEGAPLKLRRGFRSACVRVRESEVGLGWSPPGSKSVGRLRLGCGWCSDLPQSAHPCGPSVRRDDAVGGFLNCVTLGHQTIRLLRNAAKEDVRQSNHAVTTAQRRDLHGAGSHAGSPTMECAEPVALPTTLPLHSDLLAAAAPDLHDEIAAA